MKNCPNCGAQLDDNATFCSACGTAVPAEAEAKAGGFDAAAIVGDVKNNPKKYIIIAAGAVIAIALIIVLIVVLASGGGPKAVVKDYFKGMNDRDAEKLVDLVYSEDAIDIIHKEYKDIDRDALIEEYEEKDGTFDFLDDEYGDDWKYEFEITKIKDVDEDDAKDIIEAFDDTFDMEITAVKEVKVDFTVEGEEGKDKDDQTFKLYKYDGKWYIGDWEYDKTDKEWTVWLGNRECFHITFYDEDYAEGMD